MIDIGGKCFSLLKAKSLDFESTGGLALLEDHVLKKFLNRG